MSYKPFKMKGHSLPGINQRKADKTADGRPGSSALQMKTDAELKAADQAKRDKGQRQQDGKGKTDKERGAVDTKSPMKATEGGTISYLGKKYDYANNEEKEALKTKLSAMSKEMKAKEAADKKGADAKSREKILSKNEEYTRLMKIGTDEATQKAENLLNSTNSYNAKGSIGKEKIKRQKIKEANNKTMSYKPRLAKEAADKSDSGLNMKKSPVKKNDDAKMQALKARLKKAMKDGNDRELNAIRKEIKKLYVKDSNNAPKKSATPKVRYK